jgi:hypothetical protein
MTGDEDLPPLERHIDLALRAVPAEPVPPSVMASLRDIPRRPKPAPWSADVLRIMAGVIPGILLWVIRPLLPDTLQHLVPASLAFAGTVLFTTAILRFRLLGPSG